MKICNASRVPPPKPFRVAFTPCKPRMSAYAGTSTRRPAPPRSGRPRPLFLAWRDTLSARRPRRPSFRVRLQRVSHGEPTHGFHGIAPTPGLVAVAPGHTLVSWPPPPGRDGRGRPGVLGLLYVRVRAPRAGRDLA